MSAPITVVSSKATRAVLTELARAFEARSRRLVALESVGGVVAAARVRAGEAFDIVALASDAIDELLAAGCLATNSKVDLVRSGVAVAVRAGAPRPRIDSEDALERAVLSARTVCVSTGPSGVALTQLFERWGITGALRGKIFVAPPGIPVAALVACGEAELGFQQSSELVDVPGIDILGAMPPAIGIVTTFSAAVGAASKQPGDARELLSFMSSEEAADVKRRRGMEPA